jgi:hypothetical protein
MSDVRRLDAVSAFNAKLTFLIPHEWIEVEEAEEGTYLYQAPDAQSGWFRVSLITKNDVVCPAERLRELFSKYANVEVNERTGNLIRRSEKDTIQEGVRLHIYYWFVGGCVLPNIVREAVFSYTVLADLTDNDETQSEVRLLGQLAREARFGGSASNLSSDS